MPETLTFATVASVVLPFLVAAIGKTSWSSQRKRVLQLIVSAIIVVVSVMSALSALSTLSARSSSSTMPSVSSRLPARLKRVCASPPEMPALRRQLALLP